MKKIYSIVLMATALLIGTNVKAASYTIGEGGDYATLAELKTAMDNGTVTLSSADEITANVNLTLASATYDFRGATITLGSYVNPSTGKTAYYYVSGATKNANYTIQNVIIKNGKSSGAIYISKGASVTLENVKVEDCNYGLYTKIANVTLSNFDATGATYAIRTSAALTVPAEWNLVGKSYGLYAANGVTNNGTINGIHCGADVTIENNGTITKGVSVVANKTATINNNASAAFTQTGITTVSGALAINNSGENNSGEAVIESGTFSSTVSATNITINGGTFIGQLSGSDITITSGTFNVTPTAEGLINPGEFGYVKCPEGVGSLTVADGYAWRSYDQMVVRNDAGVVQVTRGGSSFTCLVEEAFANAQDGDKITLIEDVTSYSSCWLGTAEVNGAFRSVTLDLNGHTLSSAKNVKHTIELTHGALYIKNSVPGQGAIYHACNDASGKSGEIIYICGSPERMKKGGEYINPRNAAVEDLFVYLLIDEGVTLEADGAGANGVTVIENRETGNTLSQLNYYTNNYSAVDPQFSVANGVRVDIKGTIDVTKYAGKVNGTIRHPNEMIHDYPGMTDAQIGDTANGTFFHVFPTAVMHTSDASEAIAVYSSGYARWQIEGLCQGATGVYVKSGVVDITNAVIESTYTGPASITTGKTSGVEAVGYAVVVESNNHYTGQQAIVIGGDTKISTESAGGAAVVDVVDDTHDSKVESIVINGGSFTGDNAIVISSETASENTTTVNGVTVTGEISVGGSTDPADVAAIMGADTHTTVIDNPDGTTTVVVSAGAAPTAATEWVDVAALAEGSDAKWTGFTPGEIASGITVKLGELQIISGNAIDGVQQLTINDKATLKVNKLIMNDFARIIVEAGGKLIVEGEQGINAPVVDNILLKNANGKQAIFLFNPAVQSNRHPNATVEFLSKSWYKADNNYQWERFGIPTWNQLEAIESDIAGLYTEIRVYKNGGWKQLGYLVTGEPFAQIAELNVPFISCNLLSYKATPGASYKFKGSLVGNTNASLNAYREWNPFANSFSANVDMVALLEGLATCTNIDHTVYLATPAGLGSYTWDPVDEEWADGEKIAPMQAFILRNHAQESEIGTLDYNQMVWSPATASSHAPRRAVAVNENTAKMRIIVANEEGVWDNVKMTESASKSHYAEKYMNEDVNIYAIEDSKYSIVSNDNLADTYLGVSTVKGGKFTISFANVMGREFDLVDLETGARVAVAEGFEYNFTADADYVNDYRFKIVERHFAPTGIENTEAVKNAKGIFTITGQYVGEMNVWNTLPAGVYVVNGEKRVK